MGHSVTSCNSVQMPFLQTTQPPNRSNRLSFFRLRTVGATKRFSAPRTVTEHHWQPQTQKNPKIQKIEKHGGNMWKSMFNA